MERVPSADSAMTYGDGASLSPSGWSSRAAACTNSIPARSYTGASGNVTFAGFISPTPTQMFDGTQL